MKCSIKKDTFKSAAYKFHHLNTSLNPINGRTAFFGSYVSWGRRGERLVHAALDRQFDVVGVHAGLLGVCGVDFGVFNDGRHISCQQKQQL